MSSKEPFIVIVDDDADLREIMSVRLRAAGMRVTQAANGHEAVVACEQEIPDLIVMDVRMPEMSGTEAVQAIKSNPKLAGVKIVFLSNFGEQDAKDAWLDKKYAQELGAVEYIKKSEDLNAIVSRIQELLAAPPVGI